jgi:hypothetical protein
MVEITPNTIEVTSTPEVMIFDVHTNGQYDPGYNPNNPLHNSQVPPVPAGFTATGFFSSVILTWGVPTYFNHAYTEIWRSLTNSRVTATLVGSAPVNSFTDSVNPDTQYFYWIRFVSQASIIGPYNSAVGTAATTSDTLGDLFAYYQGIIDESALTAALKTRLDGIETMTAGLAQELIDRNAAVIAEASARGIAIGAAIDLEVTDRNAALVTALAVETGNRTAAVAAEATIRFDDVNFLEAQYTVKIDLNGHVSGYGLASTLIDDVPLSSMQFAVDQFSIVSPGNADLVFFVDTGTNKVMIDAAYIANLNVDQITVSTAGFIKGGQTAWNTGTGFWMGYAAGQYKFSIGSATKGMTWDGSNLAITGASLNVNNKFVVDTSGNVDIKSATTGARMEIKNNVLKVYDAAGVLRVKIGDLLA